MAATQPSDPLLAILPDATCTFCGCVCDDIEISVQDNRITEAKRACALGQSWFLNRDVDDRPSCLIQGKPASIAEGVERAARILAEAKYPLVYGLQYTTIETQRLAVSIGDWIGGTVDSTTSASAGLSGMAFQGVGEVTCTLGEIANRSDFLLFWGCNPAVTHPRHFERFSLMPEGMFLSGGRKDRTAVLVDVRQTESLEAMDQFYQIKPQADFEALWVLRGLAKGLGMNAEQVLADTGIALAQWRDLFERMKAARYGAILFGAGLTRTRGGNMNLNAVQALVKDMNAFTRFVASPMRGGGNLAGADNVITWRTGYPFGVNMSRGYPRFSPGEYTAEEMLARGETDAALIVASDPMSDLSQAACERLKSVPCISLDYRDTPTVRGATVAFTTATFGIHGAGTVYRSDGVPIPLRSACSSPHPSDFDVLSQVERRVKELVFKAGSGRRKSD
jgi:formylmethanofuran dehydrogenase subunit B